MLTRALLVLLVCAPLIYTQAIAAPAAPLKKPVVTRKQSISSPTAKKPIPKPSAFGTDYLRSALQHGLIKFDAKDIPIAVFIPDGQGIPGYTPGLKQAVKQSFLEWEAATAGKVKFTYVDNLEKAGIAISWIADPAHFPHGIATENEQYICGEKKISMSRIQLPTRLGP